ncbi:MAG: HD domain-containing protein, partial [Desulfobacterales bacterium]|nr:HD domain-containing protein [Desulfobacterales bacterium]
EEIKIPFKVASIGETIGSNEETDEKIKSVIVEVVSDGIPLLKSENNSTRGLPCSIKSFMVIPLKIRNKIFGVLTALSDGISSNFFTEKELYYLSFMTQNAAHSIENHALYENIYENFFATLYALVKTTEARDPYTQEHSDRVTAIAISIAKAFQCSLEDIDTLNFAGRLHDIGKIGIRDNILLKPGSLTQEEYEKIKEHPVIGANIVGHIGLWDKEKIIIRCHHECFDGRGYPLKLKGEEIPFLSRILSVADVYDALSSDRAYRKKMEEAQIFKIITDGRGRQFDPCVVDMFLKLYESGIISKSLEEFSNMEINFKR